MVLRDPYSVAYELATAASYQQRCADALAQIATGPDAVRGGTSQVGVAQGVAGEKLAAGRGEEIRRAQMEDHTNVLNAIKVRNEIEKQRLDQSMLAANTLGGLVGSQDTRAIQVCQALDAEKSQSIGLIQVASKLTGTVQQSTLDALFGQGYQSGSTTTASLGF